MIPLERVDVEAVAGIRHILKEIRFPFAVISERSTLVTL